MLQNTISALLPNYLYYLNPVTVNEKLGYHALFTTTVSSSLALSFSLFNITAISFVAGVAFGVIGYLVTVIAYRALMLYGAEEKYRNFEANQKSISLSHLKKLADCGHPKAQEVMGDCYYDQGNMEEALRYYSLAEQRGNHNAQAKVGFMYYGTKGIPENHALALRYFQSAAENNVPDALLGLGYMYNHGDAVQEDPKKAFHYFERAEALGSYPAKIELGEMYKEGRGCEKNDLKAIECYELGLKDCDDDEITDISYRIGMVYENNEQNGKAQYYYSRAIEREPIVPDAYYRSARLTEERLNQGGGSKFKRELRYLVALFYDMASQHNHVKAQAALPNARAKYNQVTYP